ncbi:hypothetical protein [Chitinophaga sp. LS1]|uniref:hypothetical protein n=1 Tax=Chitinophaga sp. LS1 TaxID=3051176 RepID=UPI002AABE2B4|nr:hypothetical protein [Chitinophaga sp. LS1]WPV67967.1 hypothetical protein QQL36_04410 [Chitinophaga sp. LS1]
MYNLEWGEVTPEATNIITNECLYIYNHTLKTEVDVDRTIRFVVGRLRFYDVQLPRSAKHRVKIDARGQEIPPSTVNLLKDRISQLYNHPKLLSVDIIL